MSRRQSFLAYAALVVGVISFASSFARPLIGQQPPPPPAVGPVGRYQIAVSGDINGSSVFVIDSTNGKTWHGFLPNTYDEIRKEKFDWVEFNAVPVPK